MARHTMDKQLIDKRRIGRNKAKSVVLTVLVTFIQYSFLPQVYAETATAEPSTAAVASSSTDTASNSAGIALDLSSTTRNLSANSLLTQGLAESGVVINIAGQSRAITAADFVTAGEAIAISQVVAGAQTIQLGALGNATGGIFQLPQNANSQISGLVIPQGVTVVYDAGITAPLTFSENFTNSGIFQAISSNLTITAASISATSISNLQGGLITSVPMSCFNLATENLVAHLDLNLTAAAAFINAGSIISSGNLNVTASTIVNALPAGITGPSPIMQAMQNVNLIANSGSLINSGLITATTNNINISSQLAHDLVINNTGGTLQALSGAVNIRDELFAGQNHVVLWGGNVLAKELNVYSGCGVINANVQDVLGTVNLYGGEAHIQAATPKLTLGNVKMSGDPTFYNTAGDVVVNSALVFSGAPLALVASGNIVTAAGAGAIDTSSAAGDAGAITMVAGADFTSSGPADALPPPPGDTTSTLTITGASATGGKIDLGSSNAITALNASSSAANGSGGAITLVAFAGADPESGKIILPTNVNINTSGNGTGANGDVTVIAGASAGSAIQLGPVITNVNNASGGGGNVAVANATPTIVGPSVDILDGAITAGSFAIGAVQNANMSLNGANVAGGLTLQTASEVEANGVNIAAGDINISTATLRLGGGSGLDSTAGAINLDSGGAAVDLTVIVPPGVSKIAGATGINITPTAGQNLTFTDNGGLGIALVPQLNLEGGPVGITLSNANININNGVYVIAGETSPVTLVINDGGINFGGTGWGLLQMLYPYDDFIPALGVYNLAGSYITLEGTGTISFGNSNPGWAYFLADNAAGNEIRIKDSAYIVFDGPSDTTQFTFWQTPNLVFEKESFLAGSSINIYNSVYSGTFPTRVESADDSIAWPNYSYGGFLTSQVYVSAPVGQPITLGRTTADPDKYSTLYLGGAAYVYAENANITVEQNVTVYADYSLVLHSKNGNVLNYGTLLVGQGEPVIFEEFTPPPPPPIVIQDATADRIQGSPAVTSVDENPGLRKLLADMQNVDKNAISADLQIFSGLGGDADALAVAEEETEMSSDSEKKLVILHTGKAILDTGKQPLTVKTPVGNVKIGPESTVALDIRPGKPARVIALGGATNDAVSITSENGQDKVCLASGEELIVAKNDLSEEDYIPLEGIDHQVVSGGIQYCGKQALKARVALQQYLDKEVIIAGRRIKVGGAQKAAFNRLLSHTKEAAVRQVDFSPSTIAHNNPKPWVRSWSSAEGNLKVLLEPGTNVQHLTGNTDKKSTLELKNGTIFASLPDAVTIKTHLAEIQGPKGAVLSIKCTDTAVRVKVIAGTKTTWVVSGKQRIPLAVGNEVVVANHEITQDDMQPGDGIGRRNLVKYALEDAKNAVVGDFSLPSLLRASSFVQAIKAVSTKENKKLYDTMLKTAVACQYVTGAKGSYQAKH